MICPTCKQSIHCPVCASDLPSAAPAAPPPIDNRFVAPGCEQFGTRADAESLLTMLRATLDEYMRLAAAPAVPRPDEFTCPYCFDQGAAPAVPLTDEQFADIVAEASLAVDLAANPLKLLAFARAVLSAAPVVREPQDERAAFEAWHSEYRGLVPLRRDDSYFDTHARLRWEGWQARAHGIGGGGK